MKIKMFEKVNVGDVDGDVKLTTGRIQNCQPHNEYYEYYKFLKLGLVVNDVSRDILSITRMPIKKGFIAPVITFDQYKGEISDEQRRFAQGEDYDGFPEAEKKLFWNK